MGGITDGNAVGSILFLYHKDHGLTDGNVPVGTGFPENVARDAQGLFLDHMDSIVRAEN